MDVRRVLVTRCVRRARQHGTRAGDMRPPTVDKSRHVLQRTPIVRHRGRCVCQPDHGRNDVPAPRWQRLRADMWLVVFLIILYHAATPARARTLTLALEFTPPDTHGDGHVSTRAGNVASDLRGAAPNLALQLSFRPGDTSDAAVCLPSGHPLWHGVSRMPDGIQHTGTFVIDGRAHVLSVATCAPDVPATLSLAPDSGVWDMWRSVTFVGTRAILSTTAPTHAPVTRHTISWTCNRTVPLLTGVCYMDENGADGYALVWYPETYRGSLPNAYYARTGARGSALRGTNHGTFAGQVDQPLVLTVFNQTMTLTRAHAEYGFVPSSHTIVFGQWMIWEWCATATYDARDDHWTCTPFRPQFAAVGATTTALLASTHLASTVIAAPDRVLGAFALVILTITSAAWFTGRRHARMVDLARTHTSRGIPRVWRPLEMMAHATTIAISAFASGAAVARVPYYYGQRTGALPDGWPVAVLALVGISLGTLLALYGHWRRARSVHAMGMLLVMAYGLIAAVLPAAVHTLLGMLVLLVLFAPLAMAYPLYYAAIAAIRAYLNRGTRFVDNVMAAVVGGMAGAAGAMALGWVVVMPAIDVLIRGSGSFNATVVAPLATGIVCVLIVFGVVALLSLDVIVVRRARYTKLDSSPAPKATRAPDSPWNPQLAVSMGMSTATVMAMALAAFLTNDGMLLTLILTLLVLLSAALALGKWSWSKWVSASPPTAFDTSFAIMLQAITVTIFVAATSAVYRLGTLILLEWAPAPTWYEIVALMVAFLRTILTIIIQRIYDRAVADTAILTSDM